MLLSWKSFSQEEGGRKCPPGSHLKGVNFRKPLSSKWFRDVKHRNLIISSSLFFNIIRALETHTERTIPQTSFSDHCGRSNHQLDPMLLFTWLSNESANAITSVFSSLCLLLFQATTTTFLAIPIHSPAWDESGGFFLMYIISFFDKRYLFKLTEKKTYAHRSLYFPNEANPRAFSNLLQSYVLLCPSNS